MTYTLVADGSSDAVLIPILTWSLKRQNVTTVVEQWADLSRVPRQRSTEERLMAAIDLYPCDVLFIHRDAESQAPESRREEIAATVAQMLVRHIPVVPVRMTEAWLLANEAAIRCAAGNPNGTESLDLPDIRRLEALPDPKRVLHAALTTASGRGARRRSRFRVHDKVRLIPNYIDDYSNLNVLTAFRALQTDIQMLIRNL